MSGLHTTYFVVLMIAITQLSIQHPQCLDFKAPFNSSYEEFEMCQNYKTFGCCDGKMEKDIRERFEALKLLQPDQNDTLCNQFLSSLLCQVCSPYAAHIYGAEDQTNELRTFPSLCPVYCRNLLNHCKPTVELVVNNTEGLMKILAKNQTEQFCKAVAASDRDYCFPNLLENKILYNKEGTVNYYRSTEGKCQPLCVKEVARDLFNPITMKHANDGSHRMFVGEQMGRVWIYLPDFTRLEVPFLDIRKSVEVFTSIYDERGFLDIEFHPDFKNNGRFFVCYTVGSVLSGFFITVNEMKVSKKDMNVADVKSEKVIFQINKVLNNHNGGQLLFDDEGFLVISTGDGGGQGDPFRAAQDKQTYLGKILRIDVNNVQPKFKYNIPPNNPFVNDSSYLPEIYALGIRNVWRCSKDRGGNNGTNKGRIFCGDVGQSKFEEIIELKSGANYGWNIYEGNSCYKTNACKKSKLKNYEPPIHTYPHSVGKSVTGGYFYRGCENPHLDGMYIFGDYHNGKIFGLRKRKDETWVRKNFCLGGPDICVNDGLTDSYSMKILAFGEDESGELYFLSTTRAVPGLDGGSIYKIVEPSKRGSPTKCAKKITRQTIVTASLPPTKTNIINDILFEVALAKTEQDSPNNMGIVMVTDGKNMGLICADSQWDHRDANVVCKMMGFREAVGTGSTFLLPVRMGLGTSFLSNLQCQGNENNLSECKGVNWVSSCIFHADATVRCKGKLSTMKMLKT